MKVTLLDIPELTNDGIFIHQGPDLEFLCKDIKDIVTSVYNILIETEYDVIWIQPLLESIMITTYKSHYKYVIKSPKFQSIFELIKESINKNTNSLFIPDFRFNPEIHDKLGNFYFKSGLIYKYVDFDIKVSNILDMTNEGLIYKVIDNLGKYAFIGEEVYNLEYEIIETIDFQGTKIIINDKPISYVYLPEA